MRTSTTRLARRIHASRAEVYRALLDPRAVSAWMVPDGMRSLVHRFEAREGGRFRISLTYDDPTGSGKTTPHTDTYHGRFVRLVPDEEVVEVMEFETDDDALRGEMTVTFTLLEADGGTELRAVHEGVPPGVSAADNELGWRMSLDKLAALVEGGGHATRSRDAEPMEHREAFEERFAVRWGDLDANRHVRNTIFSEFATHTRFRLLETHGFPQARFESLRFGPVMFREEVRYRRELLFGEEATVDVRFAGLSEDGSQWRARQEVTRADGRQAAVLTVDGAWIHLDSRRLVAPPADLLDLLRTLPRTADFEVMRSVLRSPGAAS